MLMVGSVSIAHTTVPLQQKYIKQSAKLTPSQRPINDASHKKTATQLNTTKNAKNTPHKDLKTSATTKKTKVAAISANKKTSIPSPASKSLVSNLRHEASKKGTVQKANISNKHVTQKVAVISGSSSKNRQKTSRLSVSHEPSPIDIHQIHFSSRSVMVYDDASNRVLYARNADDVVPIASITKLMTATVILDAHLPMHTPITVTEEDVDMLRHSSSRLPVGAVLPRRELLRLSLMSSENRATHALARTYPGGVQACVAAMNHKARALGMSNTFFADPTGLYSTNRSTAHDLMVLVKNSYQYELIQEFTTTPECKVASNKGCIAFRNTNPLVREGRWDIELSKTGFINEAGLCMVMKANIADRPVIIVLLDANSKEGRLQDANNIKRWIEAGTRHALTAGYGFRPGERS
jgi:D-alanyl-D-alanine endopeptidase (penicillin-binding protein 7)